MQAEKTTEDGFSIPHCSQRDYDSPTPRSVDSRISQGTPDESSTDHTGPDDGPSDPEEQVGQISDATRRAFDALVDDFERSGRKPLKQSHIDRVIERRRLLPSDMVAVMLVLEARGVEIIDDLKPQQVREGEETAPLRKQTGTNGFDRYLRRIGRRGLLTATEEVALGRAIANARRLESEPVDHTGNATAEQIIVKGREARRRLIEQNIRLVLSIARRYMSMSDMALEDLVQEGTLGLMRAIEKYDHTLGYKFSTYATWWIMQSITRALADRGRTIRLPVHMVEELLRVERARRMLARQRGVLEASPASIAEELDLDLARVHYLLGIARLGPISLDAPIQGQDDVVVLDRLVSPDRSPEDHAIDAERRQRIDTLLESLSPRERTVMLHRFGMTDGDEWTLERIGQSFGLTRERIRQIEEKSLKKLRVRSEKLGLNAFISGKQRSPNAVPEKRR